jgi:hypothetical protein
MTEEEHQMAFQPTLGTMVSPQYQMNGFISPYDVYNTDINVNPIQEATYPLGFTQPLFLSELEQERLSYQTKAESEYLQSIKAGLGPLNAYNQNNSYPTNYNYTTTPFLNLEKDRNNIPFKYGSSSWAGQNISRNEYQTNMGRQILDLEVKARGNRLY